MWRIAEPNGGESAGNGLHDFAKLMGTRLTSITSFDEADFQ
jgi:hypothetical protein